MPTGDTSGKLAMRVATATTFFLAMAALLLGAPPAQAARKALVLGNDSYEAIDRLRNARADADAMAAALARAGYTVTLEKDRTLRQMKDVVRAFRAGIEGGDEVVLFFSGHGVQIGGMNYLLPVDVRAQVEDQVRDDSLALGDLLADIARQKPALTLAIIDACRDNPFPKKGRAIGGRGLTGVAGATGQMVIYSAGEGQQALDRLGDNDPVRNGVFTRVFIREMERPGTSINDVVRNVREEVYKLARTQQHEQVPAIYDQVLGRFFFYAPAPAVAASAPAVPVVPATDPAALELAFWNSIKDSRDVREFTAYLQQYPAGKFTELARVRQQQLQSQSRPVPSATRPAPTQQSASPAPALASGGGEGGGGTAADAGTAPTIAAAPAAPGPSAPATAPAAAGTASRDLVNLVTAASRGHPNLPPDKTASGLPYLGALIVQQLKDKTPKAQAERLFVAYRQDAEAGDPVAQVSMANLLMQGLGTGASPVEAIKWYRKAADQGYATGQYALGTTYSTGRGVQKDEAEAYKWVRKAADQGLAIAQYTLGNVYAWGRGVAVNDSEAVKWYRKAAEQGMTSAQFSLGLMYASGRGVARDDAEAVKWYRRAADDGDAQGQNSLGFMYQDGRGVARNHVEAAKWYRKSAEQGYALAQSNLGWLYANGWGVYRDYAEALAWYRKAAEQGLPQAQVRLGTMYQNGHGVPKDAAAAVEWYRKAAAQGSGEAKSLLDQLGAKK